MMNQSALSARNDGDEANQPQLTKEKIIEKIDRINKRIDELSELKKEVKQNGTIYETDTDSRMMKTNNHGADICHNVQIAVDDKNHLVVAVDVTSEPVDKEQLHNISSQAKENLQVDEITVIADKGYYSLSQFKQCADDKITPIVSKANHNYRAVTEEYSKEAFYYDNEKGGYICPQGVLLLPYNSTWKKTDSLVYRNVKACSNCSSKDKCTTDKKGRTMHEQPFAEYARKMELINVQKKTMYKKRKQLVEHPWGTVKRAFGFSYFLTRGTESVRVESVLHFLIYDIKRVINLVGVSKLKVGF